MDGFGGKVPENFLTSIGFAPSGVWVWRASIPPAGEIVVGLKTDNSVLLRCHWQGKGFVNSDTGEGVNLLGWSAPEVYREYFPTV